MHGLFPILTPLALLAAGLMLIPWKDPAGRRRALWLLLLPVPAVALLVLGPMGLLPKPYEAGRAALLLKAQPWGVITAAAIWLALMGLLKGVRPAAAVLGVVAVFAALAIAGANEIIIAPGS